MNMLCVEREKLFDFIMVPKATVNLSVRTGCNTIFYIFQLSCSAHVFGHVFVFIIFFESCYLSCFIVWG